jgi:hypothetical protein
MKDRDRISVSVKSVYDKLAGVEPVVCEALVRETAQHLGAIITEMQSEPVLSIRGDR